jgi:hypothetical protein
MKMARPSGSPWNSLEIAKLAVGSLTPIVLATIGLAVNFSFRAADEARAELIRKTEADERERDRLKALAATRQTAVVALSRYIYERRVRSEMLLSGLKRHASSPSEESKKEVIDRKRQYDDAYVNWNTNHQSNLLMVRQILGASTYSDFEGLLEFRLVAQVFAPLDRCLTEAFDETMRNRDPRPKLSACGATDLVQKSLDCGYAITDELFRLSGPTAGSNESKSIVEARCPAN